MLPQLYLSWCEWSAKVFKFFTGVLWTGYHHNSLRSMSTTKVLATVCIKLVKKKIQSLSTYWWFQSLGRLWLFLERGLNQILQHIVLYQYTMGARSLVLLQVKSHFYVESSSLDLGNCVVISCNLKNPQLRVIKWKRSFMCTWGIPHWNRKWA